MNDKMNELLTYVQAHYYPKKMVFREQYNLIFMYDPTGKHGLDLTEYSISQFFQAYKEEISQHPEHYKTMMVYMLGAQDE